MNEINATVTLRDDALDVAVHDELPESVAVFTPLDVRTRSRLAVDAWRLAPEADPDVYEAQLVNGVAHTVIFRSDRGEIRFDVELGKEYDFIVRWQGHDCRTRIVGARSSTKDDSRVTSSSLTPNCSTTILRTRSSTLLIVFDPHGLKISPQKGRCLF
mgnify:CR=1 FL=1